MPVVELLVRAGCGTTSKHIKFEHVWCDDIDPCVQKMEWQMWTRITGEMPTHSDDGWPIEERDFDGRKKGEEGSARKPSFVASADSRAA